MSESPRTINKSKAETAAVIYVLLAGICWGIITIFIKELSAAGIGAMQISFIRMAVAAPLYSLFLLIKSPSKLKIHPKDIWMFAGTGIVSVFFFNICYFYTMIHSQASIAVVLLYTSPVFVMIMSALIFKEKITRTKLVALALTFAGCVLVAGLAGSGYRVPPAVLLTGLGSGFAYALYTIFARFALKKYSTETVTAWTFILALPASLLTGRPAETAGAVLSSPRLILFALGIGLISTVLPYIFYTRGLTALDGGKAAIIVAVEPIVGALLGMCVYNESRNAAKLAGIALILAAIILLNLPQKERSASD